MSKYQPLRPVLRPSVANCASYPSNHAVDGGTQLKNARRLATRYDKTADSYLGFIHIVSIRLWMRQFVNAS